MSDMLLRIREVFVKSGKSQTEIGTIINKTPQYIWRLLNVDDINPSKSVIEDICTKIKIDGESINPDWLFTGRGNITLKRTRNQEIQAFANDVMELPDKNLKKRLIERLAILDEDDWQKILEIAEKLLGEDKKKEEGN